MDRGRGDISEQRKENNLIVNKRWIVAYIEWHQLLLHQIPEALLACPAIARRATADEVAPCGRLRRGQLVLPACPGVICGADEDG